MATQTYLAITDGTLSATYADGNGGATNYQFAYGGWSPTVATLRQTVLGGLSPYTEVVEEIVTHVTGATPDAVLANVGTLMQLIEQAERWSKGENVAGVVIKYSPGGSTVSSAASPMQAVILGRAPGDASPVINLPGTFESKQLKTGKYVLGIRLRFLRRGEWLHTTETKTAALVDNGEIATLQTFTARAAWSPCDVSLTRVDGRSTFPAGYLLMADGDASGANKALEILNAESMTATGFTSVADAAKFARNTNVLRYTPTGTAETNTGAQNFAGAINGGSGPLAIFANVRNNSTTTVFKLRAAVGFSGSRTQYTSRVVLPAQAAAYPYWVCIGLVSGRDAKSLILYLTASAASGTLDIDSIVVVNLAQRVAICQIAFDRLGTLNVKHNLLDSTFFPKSIYLTATTDFDQNYSGERLIFGRSSKMYGLLLATGASYVPSADHWRQNDSLIYQNDWSVVRTTAYLIPV